MQDTRSQAQKDRELEVHHIMVNGTPEEKAALEAGMWRDTSVCCAILAVPVVLYIGYRIIRRAVAKGIADAQGRQ
jgi:hypothetical protein